jgi:K+-transporting ATPase ATPase A chain
MANTTLHGWLLIGLFIALTFAMAKPFGTWLFALYEGRVPKYLAFLAPVERGLYRLGGVDPERDQGWRAYCIHMLLFSAAGIFLTYAIERLQFYLPLNPRGFAGVPAPVAFNTAVSFVTNTNWQAYGGETTMSHFTQMAALAVHNFLSAATGIAIAFALIRGFARRETNGIGNFWADLTKITLYILLPISIVYALVLVGLGIPQTLAGSVTATTMEGAKQVISLGPVATAIRKMMVSPTSRMVSAISLGVFCRSAPSTRAIIRSRKP